MADKRRRRNTKQGPNDACPSGADVMLALEGEPSAERATAVLAHVARCTRCQANVDAHDRMLALCREHLANVGSGVVLVDYHFEDIEADLYDRDEVDLEELGLNDLDVDEHPVWDADDPDADTNDSDDADEAYGGDVHERPTRARPVNGHATNGRIVGRITNGYPVNGHDVNGHEVDGHGINGHAGKPVTNGKAINDDAAQGHDIDGESAEPRAIAARLPELDFREPIDVEASARHARVQSDSDTNSNRHSDAYSHTQGETDSNIDGNAITEAVIDVDAPAAPHPDARRFVRTLHEWKQKHGPRLGWPMRRWLPIAALIPIIIVFSGVFTTAPTVVRAEELLTRAAAHEHALPSGSGRSVRIRLTSTSSIASSSSAVEPFMVTRDLTNARSAPVVPTSKEAAAIAAKATGIPAQLIPLLQAHHFDIHRPLAIDEFQSWRASLSDRHDHVMLSGDMHFVLRTTTSEGLLHQRDLTVRRRDYHVVQQALVIDGVGRLEIEELAEWVRPDLSSHPPLVTSATPAIDADTLQQTELDVRMVLARRGFDLHNAIRVASTNDIVQVDGVVAAAAERGALSTRLALLPHVRVALRAPGPGDDGESATEAAGATAVAESVGAPNANTGEASPAAPSSSWPGLAGWLDLKFRSGRALARFEDGLQRHSSIVRDRLGALHTLGQRYPASEVVQLSPAARAKLRELLALHYQALRDDLNNLDAHLSIVAGSTTRRLPSKQPPADWQDRVAASQAHAARLSSLVAKLRSSDASADDTASTDTAHLVWLTFGELWDIVYANPGDAEPATDQSER